MKVIIAGTRHFDDYELLKEKCDVILSKQSEVEIVSGCAKGADTLGEIYAHERGYSITQFPAEWDRFGGRAGFIRNEEMAQYADALIAFWDNKSNGTRNMIKLANKYKLKIRVIKF